MAAEAAGVGVDILVAAAVGLVVQVNMELKNKQHIDYKR